VPLSDNVNIMSSPLPGGASAPLSDPLVPPDLRGWLDRVVGVVRRSLVPLLMIQIAVALVTGVVSYLVLRTVAPVPAGPLAIEPIPAPRGPSDPASVAQLSGLDGFTAFVGLVVMIAVAVLAQGTAMYVSVRDAAGQRVDSAEALRFALQRAPALLGWGLVAGALTMLGLLMLIVPGVYFAVVFGATLTGVVTVERAGIQRCFALVNRRLGPTFARMGLALLVAVAYSLVSDFVVHALSTTGSFQEALLQAVMSVPLGVAAVGVLVVTYAELRFHETGSVLTDTLAAELNR
jgi:hypothetical protein